MLWERVYERALQEDGALATSSPHQIWMRRSLAGVLSLVLVCGALLAVDLTPKRADALLPVSPWSFAAIGVTVAGQGGQGNAVDQLDTPSGLALDASNDLFIADTANSRVQKCLHSSSSCTTVAGQGGVGNGSDQLDHPRGVALDTSGNIYVADTANNRIQQCALEALTCTTVAGQGGVGNGSDQLDHPRGIALDANGNIYVADTANNRIQQCALEALTCTTVAGQGGVGSGNDQLDHPQGVVVDGTGNVYVADTANGRVQKCAPAAETCTTVAGQGGAGAGYDQLSSPSGLAIDKYGNLYIADMGNNRVQFCTVLLECTTPAGAAGSGSGANQIDGPLGVAVDATGNLYIADTTNNRVEEYYLKVVTVAGAGSKGYTQNQLNFPMSVAVDSSGNVYIADFMNNRIQKCEPGATICTTMERRTNDSYEVPHVFADSSGHVYLEFSTNPFWTVAYDANGNRYVNSGHGVQRCDPSGLSCTTVAGQGGAGSGADQIDFPSGVAVDAGGNLYIADSGNHRVQKCAPGSSSCTTVAGGNGAGSAANQLATPGSVAVDASGNVYVVDAGNNRVEKCAPGSTSCATVAGQGGQGSGADQLRQPQGVAVDSSGNLYIADTWNDRVQKCEQGSTSCTTVAGGSGQGSGPDQFSTPSAVRLDAGGNLYIADFMNNRVQKCAPGSTSCTTVAGQGGKGSGADQIDFPSAVAVDAGGNLYIADYMNDRVQKCAPSSTSCVTVTGAPAPYALAVDASGNLFFVDEGSNQLHKCAQGSTRCVTVAGQFSNPLDVAVDSSGNLYVADAGNSRVQKCEPDSTSCTTVAGGNGFGSEANQFQAPSGVAVDANGDLFVADAWANRVQKILTGWMNQTITFDPIISPTPAPAFASVAMAYAVNSAVSAPLSHGLSARTSSGADVSFVSATPQVCTVSGATVTVNGAGTCTVTARQDGEFPFKAASPVSRSFGGPVGTCSPGPTCSSLRVADTGANEGSGPSGTTVSTMFGIDHPMSEALCVWYSTEDATANGADRITAWDGTQDFIRLGITKPKYVILGANKTSGKISTKINYDTTPEEDEYFNVVVSKVTTKVLGKCDPLSAADPRFVLVRDSGKVTIYDDDTKGSQTAFRVADSGATEGSGPAGTTVSVMFGTDRPTAAPLCVWYSTVGVTAAGADRITAWDGTQDFTRLGVTTPKYVIVGPNRTSGKISTKINYDTTIEEDEYFNIVVSEVTAWDRGRCRSTSLADPGVVLTRDTGRVTIFDDD